MTHFGTIFRKELIDTIRDRRTLFFMVLFPLLLIPLLVTIVMKLQTSSMRKAEEQIIRVGLVTNGNALALARDLSSASGLKIVEGLPADSAESFINRDSADAIIVVSRDFDSDVAGMRPGTIRLYYRSSDDYDMVKRRLSVVINQYEKSLRAERFKRLNLTESIVSVLRLEEHDVASVKEKLGKAVGGMIPYFFVIFCFMGALYPAIDLAAGEKERGTMETLLTAPVSRSQILLGKFAVVVLAGFSSAIVSLLGMYVAIQQFREIPPELLQLIMSILDLRTMLMVLSLLVPVAAFFAAVLLSLSVFARSYKEAQSMMSPLSIVVILPAMVALMPGTELDVLTAAIPVLNVALASKEIIAGTIKPWLLVEVYVAMFLLAALSLWGCAKWFQREETIFRGT